MHSLREKSYIWCDSSLCLPSHLMYSLEIADLFLFYVANFHCSIVWSRKKTKTHEKKRRTEFVNRVPLRSSGLNAYHNHHWQTTKILYGFIWVWHTVENWFSSIYTEHEYPANKHIYGMHSSHTQTGINDERGKKTVCEQREGERKKPTKAWSYCISLF